MEEKKDQLTLLKEGEKLNQYPSIKFNTSSSQQQHLLQNNFHAHLLHCMDPRIRFSESLDSLYLPIIKQQLKYLRNQGRSVDEFTMSQQKDEATQKILKAQQVYQDKVLSFSLSSLPPQEGGVDYKKQFELLQIANLALLDEVKRIDLENKYIKSKFEVPAQEQRQAALKAEQRGPQDYFKVSSGYPGSVSQPPGYLFQLTTSNHHHNAATNYSSSHFHFQPNPFQTSREQPFVTQRATSQAAANNQSSSNPEQGKSAKPVDGTSSDIKSTLTKQHLRQFDSQNPQQLNLSENQQFSLKEGSITNSQIPPSQRLGKNELDRGTTNGGGPNGGGIDKSSISSSDYDNQFSGNMGYDRRKRYRRTANEIERRYVCKCGKSYGTEGSLNQHKKLKGHHDDQMTGGSGLMGGNITMGEGASVQGLGSALIQSDYNDLDSKLNDGDEQSKIEREDGEIEEGEIVDQQ